MSSLRISLSARDSVHLFEAIELLKSVAMYVRLLLVCIRDSVFRDNLTHEIPRYVHDAIT